MIKKYLLIFSLFFLISCGGGWKDFEGALTGQKKKTTDEYLIKKKDPLILPPDYKKLPLPDSKKSGQKSESLESILSQKGTSKQSERSPLESSIEEELRKGSQR